MTVLQSRLPAEVALFAHPGLRLGDDVGALVIWEMELLMSLRQMGLDGLEIFVGVSLDFVRNLFGDCLMFGF